MGDSLMPPSPLLLEDMLVLADMLPTLLESSMLPRGRLRPRLRLMLMLSMDMVFLTPMEPTLTPDMLAMLDTPMPMVPMVPVPMLGMLDTPMLPPSPLPPPRSAPPPL